MDKVTGRSKCFGFVRFSNHEEQMRALKEMDGSWFDLFCWGVGVFLLGRVCVCRLLSVANVYVFWCKSCCEFLGAGVC